MNELNQNLSECIGAFFSEVKDEVIKGLEEYFIINNLKFETV